MCDGTVALSGGTAQLVTTSFAGGPHTLSAAYSGDANNNPGVSAEVALAVSDPLSPPALSMTGIADATSFVAGAGGTYTGASVMVNATAATGNMLTELRIWLDNAWWNVLIYEAARSWNFNLPALSPGVLTVCDLTTPRQRA